MKKILIILFSILLISACGGKSSIRDTDTDLGSSASASGNEAPAWFNAADIEENDVEIKEKERPKATGTGEQYLSDNSEKEKPKNKIVDGFRIQLKAAKSSTKIKEQLAIARSVFNPLGYEVYLIYESPLYKLRLGDSITRKSAEKALDLSKAKGYRDSWIVPDSVNSSLDKSEE